MTVRLGYACISVPLREAGVYATRTISLGKIKSGGIDPLIAVAMANLADLERVIAYNESIGVRFFRITSSLFPHAENPALTDALGPDAAAYNSLDFARPTLERIGALARGYGHRLTMHPGQFAQLGSPRADVVEQTARDLTHNANVLLAMGYTPAHGSVLIIHGGGAFGDKSATLGRWAAAFERLPEHVRSMISLENDDYQYTVLELLPMCERLRIPLCIDFFHHLCLGADAFDIFDSALLRRVILTWTSRGIKPKCHWSDQADGKRKGAHGDYIKEIPDEILDFAHDFGVDIMCECKQKDLCVERLHKKHFRRDVGAGNYVSWSLHR